MSFMKTTFFMLAAIALAIVISLAESGRVNAQAQAQVHTQEHAQVQLSSKALSQSLALDAGCAIAGVDKIQDCTNMLVLPRP